MAAIILLGALGVLAAVFSIMLARVARARGALGWPGVEPVFLGAVTDFFDTLGIGSYAPTTAWIKLRKLAPDSHIPAVLNVGHALPTVAEAFIFIKILEVDPLLLVSCIAAAVAGGVAGAPLVLRAPVRLVQGVVGIALIIAAGLYAMSNLGWFPAGETASSLPVLYLIVAAGAHFVLGALMAFGIGLYAPSLILLSLMGLDPHLAFPIMAGSCAFLMPTTGFKFASSDRIDLKLVLGLALGGVPAVFIAAFVVKALPLETLRWGVVVVVLYAAGLLLYAAARGARARGETAPQTPSA